MSEKYIKIKILKVIQNMGEFYVGVVNSKDVKKICSAEERRVSWDDLEKYIGMQRPLTKSRVKEIQEYLKTRDATFPNSIILALKEGSFYLNRGYLYVKKNKGSSNILDGQHRLAGFFDDSEENFSLIVTFFPELSLENQAYLFSVINIKQTRINPSLAQELYAFANLETPQKIAHNLTVEFNNNPKSPWEHLIKRLGKRGPYGAEILSQSTFAKGIIWLICNNKHSYQIRDILKLNNNNRQALVEKFNYNLKKRIFWEPYMDRRDDFIFQVLKSFFQSVRDNFPKEWGNPKFILTKTTGYSALIKIFRELYLEGFEKKDLAYNFFNSYMKKSKKSNELKPLTSENYNPGVQGESRLFKDFLKSMEIR